MNWNNIFFFMEICTSRTVKNNPPTQLSKRKESSVKLFWLTWNNFQQIKWIKTEFTITASTLGFTALCDWFTFSATLTYSRFNIWLVDFVILFVLIDHNYRFSSVFSTPEEKLSLIILNHWPCNRRHASNVFIKNYILPRYTNGHKIEYAKRTSRIYPQRFR